VDIEVEDGYPAQAIFFQGVRDPNRKVVEEAETHGPIALRMVARWSDATEGVRDQPFDNHFASEHGSTGSPSGGLQAVRADGCVGIEIGQAVGGDRSGNGIQQLPVVNPQQLFIGHQRCIPVLEKVKQMGGLETVFNGVNARCPLRVACACFMEQTIFMADVGGLQGSGLLGELMNAGLALSSYWITIARLSFPFLNADY
jgi:hypothetical protein